MSPTVSCHRPQGDLGTNSVTNSVTDTVSSPALAPKLSPTLSCPPRVSLVVSPAVSCPQQCSQSCSVLSQIVPPLPVLSPTLSSTMSCPRGSHITVLSCPLSPKVFPTLSQSCPQTCLCPCAPSAAVPKSVLSPSVSLPPPPAGRVSSGDTGRGQRNPQPGAVGKLGALGQAGAGGAAGPARGGPPPLPPPDCPPGSRPRQVAAAEESGRRRATPCNFGLGTAEMQRGASQGGPAGDSDGRGARGGSQDLGGTGEGGIHPGQLGGLRVGEGSLAAWGSQGQGSPRILGEGVSQGRLGRGLQDNLRWSQGLRGTWGTPDLRGGVFGSLEGTRGMVAALGGSSRNLGASFSSGRGGQAPGAAPAAAAATALMWLRHRSAMGATWPGGHGGSTRTGSGCPRCWGPPVSPHAAPGVCPAVSGSVCPGSVPVSPAAPRGPRSYFQG